MLELFDSNRVATHIDQMRWSFEVEGQPPSVNHLYVRVRGRWDKVAKAPGVEAYQTSVFYLCKQAMPRSWKYTPGSQIRILFDFHLGRDADCDNLIKAIQDAVANALGVDDKAFLPCVIGKTTGNKDPYTRIEINPLPLPTPGPEGS